MTLEPVRSNPNSAQARVPPDLLNVPPSPKSEGFCPKDASSSDPCQLPKTLPTPLCGEQGFYKLPPTKPSPAPYLSLCLGVLRLGWSAVSEQQFPSLSLSKLEFSIRNPRGDMKLAKHGAQEGKGKHEGNHAGLKSQQFLARAGNTDLSPVPIILTKRH